MVRTGTKTPEEVDRAKALVAEATAITVMIAGKIQLQINIHLKEI